MSEIESYTSVWDAIADSFANRLKPPTASEDVSRHGRHLEVEALL